MSLTVWMGRLTSSSSVSFFFFRGYTRWVWRHISERQRRSGFFILVDRSHALVIKLVLVSDGNLGILFHQLRDGHCEGWILDTVQYEVLDDFLCLEKTINHHVYKLVATPRAITRRTTFSSAWQIGVFFSMTAS